MLFPPLSLMLVRLNEVKFRKERRTHEKNCSHFECRCSHKEIGRPTRTNKTRSPHTRVEMKLMVSFLTCIVNCNTFFFSSITIHNAFEFVYSISSISVTIQNQTHVHMNAFLTMTDTITSQNIDPPPCITLYTVRLESRWALIKGVVC
jgi:hypothetical protein